MKNNASIARTNEPTHTQDDTQSEWDRGSCGKDRMVRISSYYGWLRALSIHQRVHHDPQPHESRGVYDSRYTSRRLYRSWVQNRRYTA